MARKFESAISAEAAANAIKERQLESKIMAEITGAAPRGENKVKMNITLNQDFKDRLQKEARRKGMYASVLIQTWIDEHCE